MAVLVDAALWPWRGARWAHLVSDVSYAELHHFAQRLGKRRLGFQGDHYDVEEVDRERAIALGAESVDSRDLVRRLRAAGLRRRGATPTWHRLATAPAGEALMVERRLGTLGDAGRRVVAALGELEGVDLRSRSAVFIDERRVGVLFDWVGEAVSVGALAMVDEVWAGDPRVDGERSLEVMVHR